MQKIGILISNLGTPDFADKKSLKKYLKQFLSDSRVVENQGILWKLLLNLVILPTRPKKSAKLYQKVWGMFGSGSPLLDISNQQKDLLQASLGKKYQVELGMRYGNPSIGSAIDKLKNCSKIIILPLYPQYSNTTTASTFDEVLSVFKKLKTIPNFEFKRSYCTNDLYINALASSVLSHWKEFGRADKLVISYHGIPQTYIKQGDIYAKECEKTTQKLVEKLDLKGDEYFMAYQSRFGKMEWLKPYLDISLKQMPKQQVKSIQVICPGFSADCLETLGEIKIENKEYFLNAGGERFEYIAALNTSPEHIELLLNLTKQV